MSAASWNIVRYDRSLKKEWDEFVTHSRNSTFLFMRDYMDYHSHIFADYSLMGYRNGKLAALLPANNHGSKLYSHQGLTYGGWILAPQGIDAEDVYNLWREWLLLCKTNGIDTVLYKPLPYVYALRPSQEDLFLLFLCNSRLIRTDMASVIDFSSNPGFNKLQKRHLKESSSSVRKEIIDGSNQEKIESFHRLLTDCLASRHDARPVHSVGELKYLMSHFPENIKIWSLFKTGNEEMQAGVAVYITPMCVHCQYIATSAEGRENNVLASLFADMIDYYCKEGFRYFDFGISNECNGRVLNTGLNRQKTSYGGSGVAYQQFEINVTSASDLLQNELWPPR